MKTNTNNLIQTLCFAFLVLLALPVATAINGFVVMKLWNWFIPDLFSLRHIGWVQAMGLSLVVRYFTWNDQHVHDERETGEKIVSAIAKIFLAPAFGLLVGWIIKSLL